MRKWRGLSKSLSRLDSASHTWGELAFAQDQAHAALEPQTMAPKEYAERPPCQAQGVDCSNLLKSGPVRGQLASTERSLDLLFGP